MPRRLLISSPEAGPTSGRLYGARSPRLQLTHLCRFSRFANDSGGVFPKLPLYLSIFSIVTSSNQTGTPCGDWLANVMIVSFSSEPVWISVDKRVQTPV